MWWDFIFLNWNIVDMQCCQVYCVVIWHLNTLWDDYHSKSNKITISSRTKILQCCWSYSLCFILHTRGSFLLLLKVCFVLLNSLHLTASSHLSPGNHLCVFCYLWVCFPCCFVRFHIWGDLIFWSFLLDIMPSRYIHVVTNGKISVFRLEQYSSQCYTFFIHSCFGHLDRFRIYAAVNISAVYLFVLVDFSSLGNTQKNFPDGSW